MKAIIFDIDSTLANNQHRQHFLEGKKDWKSFLEESKNDTAYKNVVLLNQMLSQEATIMMVTGRSEEYREMTEQWLKEHKIVCDRLYMRQEGDLRPDYVIKKEILKNKIDQETYNIVAVFEDNLDCIDMWRSMGLVCYGVDNSQVKE